MESNGLVGYAVERFFQEQGWQHLINVAVPGTIGPECPACTEYPFGFDQLLTPRGSDQQDHLSISLED